MKSKYALLLLATFSISSLIEAQTDAANATNLFVPSVLSEDSSSELKANVDQLLNQQDLPKQFEEGKIVLTGVLSTENNPNGSAQADSVFYLSTNGVTVMCPGAVVGQSGTLVVGGVEVVFTKRTRDQITTQNAGTTCTSGITSMDRLFSERALNQPIGSWDVSSVTNMEMMFFNSSFNQPIGEWDVSNVRNMDLMFESSTFNQPIGKWDVSSVTSMRRMFESTGFNQTIGSWDVSSVTSMEQMFFNSSFNQSIGEWNVSNVNNMSLMFESSVFNQPIRDWNVSNVTRMHRMFQNSRFNQTIDNWNVSSVSDMSQMFSGSTTFNQDISDWDVSNVTDMSMMFAGSIFNQPLDNWNVANVIKMQRMFESSRFNQPIGNWDVSSVTNMQSMFTNSSFNQPIGSWDVSSVTNMSFMFHQSSFNQPIGSWDVRNVTDMSYMFINTSFNQDIGDWDVSNVRNMSEMLGNTPFNQDIGSWDVSNVTNMHQLLHGTDSFNQDISSWSFNSEVVFNNFQPWSTFITNPNYSLDYYNSLLQSFSNQNLMNKSFNVSGLHYSNQAARNDLVNNKGWIIVGDIYSEAPLPPTLSKSYLAPRKVKIDFQPSSSANVIRYNVYKSTDSLTYILVNSITSESYIETELQNGTTYYYKIGAVNNFGQESISFLEFKATPTNTWHVSNTGTVDGFGSLNAPINAIKAAMNLSISQDTILVGPGVYLDNINYGGKDIVLKSLNGPMETILEPLNRGITVIWFTGGETNNAILDGFTIRNGGNLRGSAINIQGANPIIKNVLLLNNDGEGAVNSWNSSPHLENCVISGSRTSIFFDSNPATPVINHCTLMSGLLNNQSYTPVVNNSIILGGASGNLSINNSIVEGGFIGNNILDINPFLTDPINGDFSLSAFSPAIGIGDSTLQLTTDILGNPRSNPSSSKPDVGAFESPLGTPTALPVIDGMNAEGTQEFKVSLNWSQQNQQLLPEKYFQHIIVYKGSSQDSLVPHDTLKVWTSNSYSDTVVIPDILYYALSITDVNGREGILSQILKVVTPNLPPKAPQNLHVSLTDTNAVRLSFDVATETDYEDSFVQGGFDILNLAPADTIYIQDGSVIAEFNNLPYQSNWIIKAEHVDFSGNISEASFTTIRTGDPFAPDTPTSLTAQAEPGLVSLSWHPSVAADLAQYRIYRGSDSTSVSLIDSVDANTTLYLDSKVINAVTYFYRVSAVDSAVGLPSVTFDPANESALSFAVSAIPPDLVPPDSPTILSFGSSNSRVFFSWSPVSAADLAGYYILRGASQSELVKIDSVSANVTTYTDLTLVNGNIYYYRVAAVDTNNNISIPSALITGSPTNALPRAVKIEDRTYNNVVNSTISVRLSAQGSSDADGSIVSTTWYAASELVSTNFDFELQAPQGSTKIKLVVMDNDLGKDSTTFYINVNAGFRSFSAKSADNAGISLIGNNYLFYPLAGGSMQILNSSFESRFDLSVGGEIRSVSSIAPDTTVYLSSTDRIVYSFDKRGIPLWDTPLGGELQATPTIDTKRNLIYVGVSNSNLFAINRTTGIVVWSFRLPNPLTQPGIILQDRYLLIITQEGEATYFDLDNPVVNRELLPTGSLNLSEVISTAPAVDRDGFIFTSTNSGKLLKYEFRDNIASGGQIIWQVQTTGKFNASPVIGYDGTVYVGASDSLLYAFDGLSGTIKWQHKMGAAISTTAAINDLGIVYVGDTSGRINAIDELGNLLWYYQSNGAIGNAMAYSDGNLIFSTLQGNLYKVYDGWRFQAQLKSKTPQDKKPQWGTYQANNRRSGSTQDQVSTSTENIIELPVDYFLSQNYPNPFNPSTQIQYGLPKEVQVVLTVYNMLGQVVATLVNQKQSAGLHSITFDASGLSSGFYIYRIQADNFVSTKKMILIK